ncbi:MAG: histidinol-phosphate transaminase [Planctomycetota bacterium]
MKPVRGVEILEAYHPPLQGRAQSLRLDFNEWVGPAHPKLAQALRDFRPEQLGVYPEDSAARARVAAQFGALPEEVTLANGTDEAFANVFRAYLGKGEGILIPDPGYAMMPFYATLCEASIVPWILAAPSFDYELPGLEEFCRAGGKVACIVRPNNPTGTNLAPKITLDLAKKYPSTLFVIDEAYAEFAGSSVLPQALAYPNVLTLRTFSKCWSMAGLRCGAVVAHKDIIATLRKMWSPYSVNVLALHLLERILPDVSWPPQVKRLVDTQRKRLQEKFLQLKAPHFFGEGNFFLVKPPQGAKAFCEGYAKRGIRLRDQSSKRNLGGWVRVSIGDAPATDRFLDVLDQVMKEPA